MISRFPIVRTTEGGAQPPGLTVGREGEKHPYHKGERSYNITERKNEEGKKRNIYHLQRRGSCSICHL